MFWNSRWKKALEAEKAEHAVTRTLFVKSIEERVALKDALRIATTELLGRPTIAESLSDAELKEMARLIMRNPVLWKFHDRLFQRIRALEEELANPSQIPR
jgi:hypothetical protein